jgi:hypothetical protein
MGMQTDILASRPRTSSDGDGQMLTQGGDAIPRARVKAILIVPTSGAGSVVLKDGGSGGDTKTTINTMASMTTPLYTLLPGEGLLFQTNIYADLTDVASVTVFYG